VVPASSPAQPVMKCERIMTAASWTKVLIAAVLIGAGVWLTMSPQVVDCVQMLESCPKAMGHFYKQGYYAQASASPGGVDAAIGNAEAEIQKFCDCVGDCVNFAYVDSVKCKDKLPPPPNSRRLEAEFAAAMEPRRLDITGYQTDTCFTCEHVESHHEHMYGLVGFTLCFLPAILLLVTAACERGGVRMHSSACMMVALAVDVVAGLMLFSGMLVAVTSAVGVHSTCDPDTLDAVMGEAAKQLNPQFTADQVTALKNALLEMLSPMASNTCELSPRFWLVAAALVAGVLVAFCSFCSTALICGGCSHDDEDDKEAMELQRLTYDSD